MLEAKILTSFCRIPDFCGVALLPTLPFFAGVFDVVLRMEDIDPSADRFRGEEYTMLTSLRRIEGVYCPNCVYARQEIRS